jgi:endonuclease V-like protein UPF0215 family
MKYFVILLTFSLTALATTKPRALRQDRQILKCLGEEEKRFHLNKEVGPIYDLNQRLISEMIQTPGIETTFKSVTVRNFPNPGNFLNTLL